MIVAMFETEAGLSHALGALRRDGIGPLETYTPAPLQDEPTTSPIPSIILVAGLAGAAASLGLQTWSFTEAYPFKIGGRPEFAWPSFIPTVFENGVLVAIATGIVAYLLINRMPRLYDPIDELPEIRRASRDRWFLQVCSREAGMLDRARHALRGLHAVSIDEMAE